MTTHEDLKVSERGVKPRVKDKDSGFLFYIRRVGILSETCLFWRCASVFIRGVSWWSLRRRRPAEIDRLTPPPPNSLPPKVCESKIIIKKKERNWLYGHAYATCPFWQVDIAAVTIRWYTRHTTTWWRQKHTVATRQAHFQQMTFRSDRKEKRRSCQRNTHGTLLHHWKTETERATIISRVNLK